MESIFTAFKHKTIFRYSVGKLKIYFATIKWLQMLVKIMKAEETRNEDI